jgi:hypothetical protein
MTQDSSQRTVDSLIDAAKRNELYSSLGIIVVAGVVAATVGLYSRSPLLVASAIASIIALAFFIQAGGAAIRSFTQEGPKSPFIYFQHALLLLLLIAFAVALVGGVAYGWRALTLTIPPERYPYRTVDFDVRPLSQANPRPLTINLTGQPTQQFQGTMAALWTWLYKGATPLTQAATALARLLVPLLPG